MRNQIFKIIISVVIIIFGGIFIDDVYAATFLVTNTNDSGVGSLRQAIIDSESTVDADSIEFAIPTTDPNYDSANGWFRIRLLSPLPNINNELSIYGYSQTTNIGDTNSGLFGYQGDVGVDQISFDGIDLPEIVISPDPSVDINNFLIVNSDNFFIEGFAIFGFGITGATSANVVNSTIHIQDSINATIQNNIFGSFPTYPLMPIDKANNNNFVGGSSDTTNFLVKNNYFINTWALGVFLYNATTNDATDIVIEQNEFRNIGMYSRATNAIELQSRDANITGIIRENYLINNYGRESIDIAGATGGQVLDLIILNNTILSGTDNNSAGIRLRSTSNSYIHRNIIESHNGSGIVVFTGVGNATFPIPSVGNTISQNHFGNNTRISIDLCNNCAATSGGDSINQLHGGYNTDFGNDGLDHPIYTAYLVNDEYIYVSGTTQPNAEVELYIGTPDMDNSDLNGLTNQYHGEGSRYLTSTFANSIGEFATYVYYVGSGINSTDQITAITHDINGNTSEFGANVNMSPIDARIGLAKSANVNSISNNEFLITYTFTIENLSSEIIENIDVIDNISEHFPNSINFTIESLTSSTLNINPNYDGVNDISLLAFGESLLPNQSATIQLVLRVITTESISLINSAQIIGLLYNIVPIADISNQGNIIDANNNGIANEDAENIPTQVNLVVLQSTLTQTGSTYIKHMLIISAFSIILVLISKNINQFKLVIKKI
jgi:hypothetical protein